MDRFEIENCLESMTIVVDSAEQRTERAAKRYAAFSVPYHYQKIDFGDYTYNFTMPDGTLLYPANERIYPDVVIERKMDLEELSKCFTERRDPKSKEVGARNRFEREFMRAKAAGSTVYLLVEEATWEKLINGRYDTKYNPKSFFASVTAWMARYNYKPIFCQKEISGKLIQEILYRELKERLERGDYG